MDDYEKLGVFYLGRPYDLAEKKSPGGLFLYDSKDLVTHAVCVGMTGSGKTGLCISLLEEAAMDGIPAIAIDPKGDLTNLLLTFPELRPEDFLPWVNEEDAQKKGLSAADYAARQAATWKDGLASWGQSGDRIRRLRQAADFAIYTPGSTAGIPVSILESFAPPSQAILDDDELLRDRIDSTATSLLGIIGVDADPIRSREHILISTLLGAAWTAKREMGIASLIQQIQTPPMTRIGVMDIDSFFPAKDRFTLALALNNLIAAPGFASWLEGDPLDIASMLHTPGGKPRVSIFSIAHLSDAERMFFVSLLLNQVLGWMRSQSGTTSLRAILYMDEIFGYFPPVANPPSKKPLLTLLKQARAFGVGVVLATQNPVDLDYKGLSNTGTWFLGRLQTERDKARVLEGLEGVAAGNGVTWNRQAMEQTLAGLSNRVFLMNNVHDDAPAVFETRWAMSYLRGPLTRNQIKQLMDPAKANAGSPSPAGAPASPPPPAPRPLADAVIAAPSRQRPVAPPSVPQVFAAVKSAAAAGSYLFYQPAILGAAQVHFSDARTGVNLIKYVTSVARVADDPIAVDWEKSAEIYLKTGDIGPSPHEPAAYADVPAVALKGDSYAVWKKAFADWLLRTQQVTLWRSPSLKEISRVNESERDFRVRLQEKGREERDAAADRLRQKYAPKLASVEEQLRRAQATVEREKEQARQQQMETALSFGTTLLGGFLGRKRVSAGSLGRARSTVSRAGRSMKEAGDVKRAQDTVVAMQQRMQQLDADFRAETGASAARIDAAAEQLEPVYVRAARTGILVQLFALGWLPYWRSADGSLTEAW